MFLNSCKIVFLLTNPKLLNNVCYAVLVTSQCGPRLNLRSWWSCFLNTPSWIFQRLYNIQENTISVVLLWNFSFIQWVTCYFFITIWEIYLQYLTENCFHTNLFHSMFLLWPLIENKFVYSSNNKLKFWAFSHVEVRWEQLSLTKQSLTDYKCYVKVSAIKDV